MKTVSLKKLKEKGWELTSDSKKAVREQKSNVLLSEQIEAIKNLKESIDGIKDTLRVNTGKDYSLVIDKLTRSIQGIKIESAPVTEQKNYRFIINRGPDGMITEIEAMAK